MKTHLAVGEKKFSKNSQKIKLSQKKFFWEDFLKIFFPNNNNFKKNQSQNKVKKMRMTLWSRGSSRVILWKKYCATLKMLYFIFLTLPGWSKVMKNLEQLKRQFLEYVEIEKGRALKTVENYDHYLSVFLEQTKAQKPEDIDDNM